VSIPNHKLIHTVKTGWLADITHTYYIQTRQ